MAAMRRRGSKDAGGGSKGVKASASVVVAVVGDVGVGKTCLLLAYLSGKCPSDYLQGPVDWHSEFDHLTRHPVKLEQDGVEVSMTLVDTCGLDEYQKLREKVCVSADAFLVCFDVTCPTSLERVKDQWLPEIRKYNSAAPFVLVATKCDERIKAQIEGKPSSATVSFSQAKAMAQELGAKNYCESSAKNATGLKKVFEEAAQAGLQNAFPGGVDRRTSCVVS
ncbi:cdc42 homolog [Babylonia areolata]|uniref:cdc42 homolog n=1 Tax=Babylonia areolata TaxID=304850 RepID=UPI003FD3A2A0